MVLPLIAVAMALLSKKQQDEEQKRAEMSAINRDLLQNEMSIQARRASRAGDSGYMQAAMGGAGFTAPRPSPAGPMLTQVAGALLSQRDEPQVKSAETPSNTTAPQLRGIGTGVVGYDDDPYKRSYYNGLA